MKLICLCGGIGDRAKPLSNVMHKSVLPLGDNGERNIIRNINLIHSVEPLSEVIIVCKKSYYFAYHSEFEELIDCKKVTWIENDNPAYNNWYTMKLGLQYVRYCSDYVDDEPLMTIEGDIYLKDDFKYYLLSALAKQFFNNHNVYFCKYRKNEWVLSLDTKGTVRCIPGGNGLAMCGATLLHSETVHKLYHHLLKKEQRPYSSFWDEHLVAVCPDNLVPFNVGDSIVEYDSIKELIDQNLLSPSKIAELISSDGEARATDSMTNTSYLINYRGKESIIRFPGRGTEEFIDREREEFIHKAVESSGITPNSEFFPGGVKITDFVDLAHCSSVEDISKVVNLLGTLHSIKVEQTSLTQIDLISELDSYEKLYHHNFELPENYDKVNEFYRNKIIELQNQDVVLCHRDLDPRNILVTKDKSYLIDFEYAGHLSKYWDLGAYLSELSLHFDYEIEDSFKIALSEYEKKTQSNVYFSQVLLWSGIVDFVWSCWTIAKISLGEDYEDYFRKRWNRACKIYENQNMI